MRDKCPEQRTEGLAVLGMRMGAQDQGWGEQGWVLRMGTGGPRVRAGCPGLLWVPARPPPRVPGCWQRRLCG